MSENPKITSSEMGNATLELFNMLTKLLDTFADVGTEKIIEAMMRSSASMNSSSNEMMETRKQILARVFLKSLQTDDTVFKKVSRSVYCAFRAIILGGSGEKGRKLADASLRRIGATMLASVGMSRSRFSGEKLYSEENLVDFHGVVVEVEVCRSSSTLGQQRAAQRCRGQRGRRGVAQVR